MIGIICMVYNIVSRPVCGRFRNIIVKTNKGVLLLVATRKVCSTCVALGDGLPPLARNMHLNIN